MWNNANNYMIVFNDSKNVGNKGNRLAQIGQTIVKE